MKNIIKNISIGLRLKLAIVIPVNVIVIILGIGLYSYQKDIIFEQAKKNSYASLGDLIQFIENEIDASRDKVDFFGQAALTYLNGLGTYRLDTSEQIEYSGKMAGTNENTTIMVPAIYSGETLLQKDTSIYRIFKNMGIEFFHYYQKVDDYYVNVLNSHNQEALLKNEAQIYPLNYSGTWQLSAIDKPTVKASHWPGSHWMQTIRLFIKNEDQELIGIIVVGIKERNEVKLAKTFVEKSFYETGFCYQADWKSGGFSYHPNLPFRFESDNPALEHIIAEQMIEKPSYVEMTDSVGIEKILFYQYFPSIYHHVIIEIPEEEIFTSLHVLRNGIFIAVIIIILLVYTIITLIVNSMTDRLDQSVSILKKLARGDTSSTNTLSLERNDEIGVIAKSVNELTQNLNSISEFAGTIGLGQLNAKYEALSKDDTLGNALLDMQKSLVKAKEDEEKNKIIEEKNRWTSNGLAKFSDIIRLSNDDFKDLSYNIVKHLIDYLNISMGALYVTEKDNDETLYVPQAAVAYERRKIINQKIKVGEGLVGRCAFEKLSIYISDIPDNYMSIRSGLGGANPGFLLIVPLISDEEVMGVMELASFNAFEEYKISFIEKLAETIGSTLKSAKVNQQTVELLKQSKLQSEELAAQEEEMRQNMEELQSTQEEAHRREADIMEVIESLNQAVFKVAYDAKGNITDINAKYATFLNSDVEQLFQKDMAHEYRLLGCSINNVETIMSKLLTQQSYSATIQANINGESYNIQEHYTISQSTEDSMHKRIIKISYITN